MAGMDILYEECDDLSIVQSFSALSVTLFFSTTVYKTNNIYSWLCLTLTKTTNPQTNKLTVILLKLSVFIPLLYLH